VTRAERISIGSILIGCVVLALKSAAWRVTGSVALFSDALETTTHIATGGAAFLAVRFAAVPADANHTYGHTKAELFAAVIVGALVVLASFAIFGQAWRDIRAPRPLTMPGVGILISAIATVLNAAWSSILTTRGRTMHSPALMADGRHLQADVVTSTGIIIGVALVAMSGLLVLDACIAALAGIYVLWSGLTTISASVGGLMDAAPPPEVVARIRGLVSRSAAGALEAHDLRMRYAGRVTFLEFHLVVPGAMTVAEAHAICDRIEEALKADMGELMITIHVEPEAKSKQHGVPVL
jgi:cation diffusion facilitator family transporter